MARWISIIQNTMFLYNDIGQHPCTSIVVRLGFRNGFRQIENFYWIETVFHSWQFLIVTARTSRPKHSVVSNSQTCPHQHCPHIDWNTFTMGNLITAFQYCFLKSALMGKSSSRTIITKLLRIQYILPILVAHKNLWHIMQ